MYDLGSPRGGNRQSQEKGSTLKQKEGMIHHYNTLLRIVP